MNIKYKKPSIIGLRPNSENIIPMKVDNSKILPFMENNSGRIIPMTSDNSNIIPLKSETIILWIIAIYIIWYNLLQIVGGVHNE